MKPLGPIPEGFATLEGELAVGGRKASELAGEGTPLFVYSSGMIERRVAQLRAAMPPRLHIHYAMKANPYRPVLEFMGRLVDGFDIASGGELEMALTAGLAAGRISFAGPGKRDEKLTAAIVAGVTLNPESENEARRALAIAER